MNKAFESLYVTYSQRVYAFLFRLCGDSDIAEELTQETFYQAMLSLRRFQGKCDIYTWLVSIAKHLYYKHIKKNHQGLSFVSTELIADVCADTGSDPEEILQDGDICDKIRSSVKNLPEKYRDVVIMRVYADMSFAQTANALNISENSAKVIFFRAKKLLAEELENEITV